MPGTSDVLNVRDYGALGDWDEATGCGTDDTEAIQAALDAGAVTGQLVVFPAGAYKVTQRPGTQRALQVRTNNHLWGWGNAVIRIADDYYSGGPAEYTALEIEGGEHGIRIRDLGFRGNNNWDITQITGGNAAIYLTGHAGPYAVASYDVRIEGCWFDCLYGFPVHGTYEHSYDIVVTGCTIRKCSNGINLNAAGEISRNYFEDSQGIENYSGNVLIEGNRFRRVVNNGIAIGGGGIYLDGTICRGNIIESTVPATPGHAASGIIVGAGARSILIDGNVVQNAHYCSLIIHNAGQDPEVWYPAKDVRVSNNTFRGSGNSAVYVTDGVSNITFFHNSVTGAGISALNLRSGSNVVLGEGNHWRTNNPNQYDLNIQQYAQGVKISGGNDFRRAPSIIHPAAGVEWY